MNDRLIMIGRTRVVTLGRVACVAAMLAGGAVSMPSTAWAQANVIVEHDPSGTTTRYRVGDAACQVTWTTTEGRDTIAHMARCPGSFSKQLTLLPALVTTVFADPAHAARFKTIFIGGFTALPEFSARLAVAATRSPQWDAARGRPREGLLNPFVAALLQEQHILDEWQQLFASVQRTAAVSSVEQVQVSVAAKLPFYHLMRDLNVQEGARVPYNCIVWLSLSTESRKAGS